MTKKLLLSKALLVIAALLIAASPTQAFAHENVGGDELAAANWMLLGALVVAVTGVLAGIWAWRSGQFSNIEESKYTMLELADDYDAIMSEVDLRDQATATSLGLRTNSEHVAGA